MARHNAGAVAREDARGGAAREMSATGREFTGVLRAGRPSLENSSRARQFTAPASPGQIAIAKTDWIETVKKDSMVSESKGPTATRTELSSASGHDPT